MSDLSAKHKVPSKWQEKVKARERELEANIMRVVAEAKRREAEQTALGQKPGARPRARQGLGALLDFGG